MIKWVESALSGHFRRVIALCLHLLDGLHGAVAHSLELRVALGLQLQLRLDVLGRVAAHRLGEAGEETLEEVLPGLGARNVRGLAPGSPRTAA